MVGDGLRVDIVCMVLYVAFLGCWRRYCLSRLCCLIY